MAQTVIDGSQDWATWSAGAGLYLGDFSIVGGTNDPPEHEWGMLANSMFAYLYPHTRGAGLSLKGRASNTTGVIADIVAANDGEVMRRSGSAIGFGTVASAGMANDAVTDAKLRNSGARSVIGRAANSSGDPADISGSGTAAAPQVLSDNGTTAAFRSFTSLRDTAEVYEDTDWAALATNVFTDGTEVVNSINHTVVQSALAGASWGMVNGSGFVWSVPNNLARTWTASSLTTAPYFYRLLSTVPGLDYSRPIIIDVHLTGQVYENGNDAFRVGLWEPAATPYAASTARFRIIDRGNFSSTSTLRTFDGTSAATSAEAFAPDCIRIVINPDGTMRNYYGTWAGGWPAQWLPANRLDTTSGVLNGFSAAARIVFAFINSVDASPTTTATIANVRYSRG